MKLFHQMGHNGVWNIESHKEDNTGDGLIFSPVNRELEKIENMDADIKKNSIFDPQFYLPKELKSKLSTYDFFPSNFIEDFETSDFKKVSEELSKKCIDFQLTNDFKYLIIPTRYYEFLPSDYYKQLKEYFINPFIDHYQKLEKNKEVLTTIIVKEEQLVDENKRNFLLNWLTGIQDIDGIYLIFENNFNTKQIKDPSYLFNALKFIHSLKQNKMKVIIGYTNTEGFLYSIANPDGITMGVYENLRNFGIKRFKDKKSKQYPPNPRLYSGKLFQWIDYGYIEPMKDLYDDWENIFEETKYKPLVFDPEFNWHFNKPELYKHFFKIFSSQIKNLPQSTKEKINVLTEKFKKALNIYKEINNAGIFLDENSNGDHLNFWLTTINMYKKYIKGGN